MDADFGDILAASQTGADWALAELYRRFNPGLQRFLSARVGASGEDLCQETWMAAARGVRGFQGDERGFKAWLFTIGRRRVIEHHRRAVRRPSQATEDADLERLLGGGGAEPGADLEADEAVAALVAGLPADLAEIVLLRVVGGFEADEVARIVGKSAGAVRVAQHRALRRIARRLGVEPVTP